MLLPAIIVARYGISDYICDGEADQVEINLAIDRVSAAGGGTVWLKTGRYILTAPIVMKSQVNLIGFNIGGSREVEIVPPIGAVNAIEAAKTSDIENIRISMLKIAGEDTPPYNTGAGIWLGSSAYKCIDFRIDNVLCHRWMNQGIRLTNCHRGTIISCQVEEMGEGIILESGCRDVMMVANWVESTMDKGIMLETNVERCVVANNVIDGYNISTMRGVLINPGTSYCSVVGNSIARCGQEGIRLKSASNNTIGHNVIKDCASSTGPPPYITPFF